MKPTRSLLAALFFGLVACGGSGDPGPCTEGRACPIECTTSSSCEGGATCQDSVCAQPAPLTGTFAACGLDADCPRGDHCSLGACAHDCVRDSECGAGKVCTNRGRCVTLPEVGAPEPVPTAKPAVLRASSHLLDFGLSATTLELTLFNDGSETATFRVLADQSWVSVEPSFGQVGAVPVTVRVTIDRANSGGLSRAGLRVNSTAGTELIELRTANDLSGEFAGEVTFSEPLELGSSVLHLNLFQVAGTTDVVGYADPSRSILFSQRSGVSGGIASDRFHLSMVTAGGPGSAINPSGTRGIRRTLSLEGTVSAAGALEGFATETIEGPMEGRAVSVRGTFRMQRKGPAIPGQAEPVPSVTWTPVGSPFTGDAYAQCRTECPAISGANCSTPLNWGLTWFSGTTSMYDKFSSYAQQKLDAYGSAVGSLNTVYQRCAEYQFAQAIFADPGRLGAERDLAEIGLLDSLELSADAALLEGNKALARALAMTATSTLDNELSQLTLARNLFAEANHSASDLTPTALLDPYMLKLVEDQVSPATQASVITHLGTKLKDYSTSERTSFEHLRRHAQALAGQLRADVEIADRLRRMGRDADARAAASSGAMSAFLDAALLADLLDRSGGTTSASAAFSAMAADFTRLSKTFDDINAGRNPAGFSRGYIPFFFQPESKGSLGNTNFEQIVAQAQAYYSTVAGPALLAANTASRDFELTDESFTLQLNSQDQQFQERLQKLCGRASAGDDCGDISGDIYEAKQELLAAAQRVLLADTRRKNLDDEIAIEKARAAELGRLSQEQLDFIAADGSRLNVIAEQKAALEASTSLLSNAMDIVGGWPFKTLTALAKVALPIAAHLGGALGEGEITRMQNDLATEQKARAQTYENNVAATNSAAVIATKRLEEKTLEIEQVTAGIAVLQAASRAKSLMDEVTLLGEQLAQTRRLQGATVKRMLHQRLLTSVTTEKAQISFREMLRWGYLVVRAYEYELNEPYPFESKLWQKQNADELNQFIGEVKNTFNVRHGISQPFTETLSLREDLLDLRFDVADPVTGHEYTQDERFHRWINDPTNRDVRGNLKFSFMTYRPDKELFTRAICADRIDSVQVNLIGDNLGAGVTTAFLRLVQRGTGYLRSCADGSVLSPQDMSGADNPPRVAVVQAGVNAPNASTLMHNTDLVMRPLLGGPWELEIDLSDPANRNLDLSGLRDIELVINHRANTIQTP